MSSLPYYARRPSGTTISRVDPPPVETIYLPWAPEQHDVQGGGAIWEEIPHARGETTLEYRGRGLSEIVMDVPFDGLRGHQQNVERDLGLLRSWWRPTDAGGASEPPRLALNFGWSQQLRWVIVDLDIRSSERGNDGRVNQALVRVHLKESRTTRTHFTPLEEAQAQDAASTDGSSGLPYYGRQETTRSYTVRDGDTLFEIAARELGDGNRWGEIKTLNGLDSDLIIVGQTLLLPAA